MINTQRVTSDAKETLASIQKDYLRALVADFKEGLIPKELLTTMGILTEKLADAGRWMDHLVRESEKYEETAESAEEET